MNCHDKYLKLVEDGDFEGLADCYRNNNSFVKNSQNPLNEFETCKLISSRKKEYYKFIYDPQPIINKLLELEAYEYLDNLENTFDLTKRKNCCNCISLMLYSLNFNTLLYDCLPAILKTIENVYNNLPYWLVRIYIDPSIYEIMEHAKFSEERSEYEIAISLFNSILSAENVEIYTYFCKSIINKEEKIERTRFFHFLSFADHTVNICAIREANVIVTNLDCHNLDVFSKNSSIFYEVPFHNGMNIIKINLEKRLNHILIRTYKTKIDQRYKERIIPFEFLIETTSIKLQVKKEAFISARKNLIDLLNRFYEVKLNKLNETREFGEEDLDDIFNEMFLLNLFYNFITVKFTREKSGIFYNEHETKIVHEMFSFNNFDVFHFNSFNMKQIIKTLKDYKIISKNVKFPNINKKLINCLNLKQNTEICITFLSLYAIDKLLTKENIICNQMFNVSYGNNQEGVDSILSSMNIRYDKFLLYDFLSKNKIFERKFMDKNFKDRKFPIIEFLKSRKGHSWR